METAKLIRECSNGSITSQKYMFDKYANKMYLLCRRYMRTNEMAEEAMMNGFYQCFKSLPAFSFVSEEAFVAWLKRIFVNESLQMLRKNDSLILVSDIESVDSFNNHGGSIIDSLSAYEIYGLIAKLPIGYKTVFNLFVVEGYGHKEIAAMLAITEGTSKSQLSKARLMLQQMITGNNKILVANGQ